VRIASGDGGLTRAIHGARPSGRLRRSALLLQRSGYFCQDKSDPRVSAEAVDLLSLFFEFCFHRPSGDALLAQSGRAGSRAFRALSARATPLLVQKNLAQRNTPRLRARRRASMSAALRVLSAGSAATEGPEGQKPTANATANARFHANERGPRAPSSCACRKIRSGISHYGLVFPPQP